MSEIEIRKIHRKISDNETIYWIYGSFFLLFGILENFVGEYQIAAISIFIFVVARPSTTRYIETKLMIKIPRIFIFCNVFFLTAALFFPIGGIIFSLVTIFIFLLNLLRKQKNDLNLVEYPSEASNLLDKSKSSAPYDSTWSLIKKIVYSSFVLFFLHFALSTVDAGEKWRGAIFFLLMTFFLAKLFSQMYVDSRARADLVEKAQVNTFVDKSKVSAPYDPTWSLIKKAVYFSLFLFFLYFDVTVLMDKGLWWRVVFFLLTSFFFAKLFSQMGADSRARADLVEKAQVNTLVDQSEASTIADQSQASVLVGESQEHILWPSLAHASVNTTTSKSEEQEESIESSITTLFGTLKNSKIASVMPDLSTVDKMTGEEFEDHMMYIYERLGYSVKKTPKTGDQGADLILTSKVGAKTAVQVKRYSTKVSNGAVQEVVASKGYYKCTAGLVVTNNYFTAPAVELAKANDIGLVDRDELKKLMRQAR